MPHQPPLGVGEKLKADFWQGLSNIYNQGVGLNARLGGELVSGAYAGQNSGVGKGLDALGGSVPFGAGSLYTTVRNFMMQKKGGQELTPEEEAEAKAHTERLAAAQSEADKYTKGYQDNLRDIQGLSDPNSAYFRQTVGRATDDAQRQASNSGIRGGLSVANTQNAAIGAQNNIRLQQLQLQGQGLNSGSNFAGNQQLNAQNERNRTQDVQYRNAQTAYQNQQNASPFGAFGAILGGLGGAAVGGAAGIQPGAQVGLGAGRAVTSMNGSQPSYGGGSGGLGNY